MMGDAFARLLKLLAKNREFDARTGGTSSCEAVLMDQSDLREIAAYVEYLRRQLIAVGPRQPSSANATQVGGA